MTATRVIADGLTFTEAPRWRDGLLWFSDFYSNGVYTVAPDGRLERRFDVAGRPSGLGWLPGGDLLVVSMTDRRLLRHDGHRLHDYADLSALAGGDCNDLVVTADGTALVGNFGFDVLGGDEFRPADLLRVTPDRRVAVAAEQLHFPNGPAIVDDGATLVVAESYGRRLTAFDLGAGGVLTNRRLWADLGERFPDGICADRAGGIWVATPMSDGDTVVRVEYGGTITHRLGLDRDCFACAITDDNRSLLLCTSAHAAPDDCVRHRSARIELVDVAGL